MPKWPSYHLTGTSPLGVEDVALKTSTKGSVRPELQAIRPSLGCLLIGGGVAGTLLLRLLDQPPHPLNSAQSPHPLDLTPEEFVPGDLAPLVELRQRIEV